MRDAISPRGVLIKEVIETLDDPSLSDEEEKERVFNSKKRLPWYEFNRVLNQVKLKPSLKINGQKVERKVSARQRVSWEKSRKELLDKFIDPV